MSALSTLTTVFLADSLNLDSKSMLSADPFTSNLHLVRECAQPRYRKLDWMRYRLRLQEQPHILEALPYIRAMLADFSDDK